MSNIFKIPPILILTFLTLCFFNIKESFSKILDVKTPAKQVIIYDHEVDEVLFEKNADQLMKPASMAKVMTSYIVFDRIKDKSLDLSDTFIVSDKAWKMGGSRSFLELNSEVTVKDLLLGLIVQSGNDAAVVLAEGVSGDEEAFAREMNRYAKTLGMKNTYFTNSTGWPHPDLQTTSRDLIVLTKRIIEDFPELYRLFEEKIFTYNKIKQSNRNPLLYTMNGADGLKTGHTNESGYGLIGSVKRNDRRVTLVINGLNSKKKRRFESKRLLNIVFRETALLSLFNNQKSLAEANVWLGNKGKVDLIASKPFKKIISPFELNKTKIKLEWRDPIPAPIKKGSVVGKIYINIPGQNSFQEDLVSSESIYEMSSLIRVKSILKFLLYGDIVAN